MPIEIRKKPNPAIFDGIRALTKNEALVGVPAENAGRQPEEGEAPDINNAELGYIHEFGGTIKHPGGTDYVQDETGRAKFVKSGSVAGAKKTAAHEIDIPPRPFLRPGIEDARDKIASQLEKGVKGALRGDVGAADKALNRAGQVAQNAVRNKINDGPFKPLAPATLKARRKRGVTRTNPLIDTGALRNAQTYVVRPKGDD